MQKVIASLYKITHQLGSGSGGIVYLGRQLRLDKDVVLKTDIRSSSESIKIQFNREVDTLKNLSHTYIPRIYDFVTEDSNVYTVMDYIEGESLDIALERGERFTPQQIVRWAKQVLEALVYLHSRPPYGILHSDIKPANIMLTPQGDIRLIDFNIALALGEDGAVSVGHSQGYASPEHFGIDYSSGSLNHNSKQSVPPKTTTLLNAQTDISSTKTIVLDARSDIYGLGATLYHLITGRRPARNAAEVIPLTADDSPPGLAAIIKKAMAPDMNLRFQSADDMLAAFDDIHKNDARARRHRRWRGAVITVLALLLAIGLFVTFIGVKRMEAENKAEALVEASRIAYLKGDKTGALRLALDAAPAKNDLFTPPVSAGAKKALADALGVYDLSEGFTLHHTITLPSAPLMADLSPDGKTAAVVYAYEAAVIDLESGQAVKTVPMTQSVLAEARFLNNTTLICSGRDGLCAYDLTTGTQLWRGALATAIAISTDGSTIAAINRDDDFAMLYDENGEFLGKIDFNGRKQNCIDNDIWNMRDNMFALSSEGRFLAVSFADGLLTVFDTLDFDALLHIEPHEDSDYIRYEGGFSGIMLAFSATSKKQGSDFTVFDMESMEQLGNFASSGRFGVVADDSGIFISSDNIVVHLNPINGEQQGLARADSDVTSFAVGSGYILAALNNGYAFFDRSGQLMSRIDRESPTDIALLSGDYALLGGRDGLDLTILRFKQHDSARLFKLDDAAYHYHEARVSADGNRFMFFSIYGFRIYDLEGTLIREQVIPDSARVYDQQFSKKSGNLAVIYKDALIIFSGQDGEAIYSETDLRSVFYAPYGVSVLDANGRLNLIDLDSGEAILAMSVEEGESFAAHCGITVDSAFLGDRTLIGAAKTSDGYVFAVSDGTNGTIYDGNGNSRFNFPVNGQAEAFFTETGVVISPTHGSPVVYSLKNSRKIADLEKDTYLIYIIQMGEYTVSQYLSTNGELFGILLDNDFQPIANLPNLCDVWDGQLVFDYHQGVLQHSRVYTLSELLDLARMGQVRH